MNVEKIKQIQEAADTSRNDPDVALVLIRELCKAILEPESVPTKRRSTQ